MRPTVFLLSALNVWLAATLGHAQQSPFSYSSDDTSSSETYQFPHPIRRVAVIGAGPAGLQAAAALVDHGFEVRLFDRTRNPGGNWQYSGDVIPIPASFPYVLVDS